VHDVVTQHGGRAWVEDAPRGHGARIVVTLPALREGASSVDEHDPTENQPADAPAVHT